MTNRPLAACYLSKALALKALLRHAAVEPPKWHDVSSAVREFHKRYPSISRDELDIDFIPSEQYGPPDAQRAIDGARFVVEVVTRATKTDADTRP